MDFAWDPRKNLQNQRKHGVSFEEAQFVFLDENALIEYDSIHSENEERFRILGCSDKGNILLVVYCIVGGDTIRIISSRKATRNESNGYYRRLIV